MSSFESTFSTPISRRGGLVATYYDGCRQGTWVRGRLIKDRDLLEYGGQRGLMHAFMDIMVEEQYQRNIQASALMWLLGYFRQKGKPQQAWVNMTVRRYKRRKGDEPNVHPR